MAGPLDAAGPPPPYGDDGPGIRPGRGGTKPKMMFLVFSIGVDLS